MFNEQLINNIHQFIANHQLIPQDSTIVLGLSGGPDSIFLLHLLARMRTEKNMTLIAAHLDHEWRAESAQEVKFCQEAAKKLGVPIELGQASKLGTSLKFDGSQEELGRKMRRHFFQTVAQEHQANLIALAHHLQDQEETFFIRLIRGTTLTGLTAMRPKHGMYIRPLLATNKQDILTYLDHHAIAFITDPTNNLPTFLRNRIRLTVLPVLRACDKRFDQNFLHTLEKLKAAEHELQHLTYQTFNKITSSQNDMPILNINLLLNLSDYMQKRILIHWLIEQQVPFTPQESFLNEILKFIKQPSGGEHVMHETWRIIKKKNNLFIKKT